MNQFALKNLDTYENFPGKDFEEGEEIVAIAKILEEVPDVAAGLEKEDVPGFTFCRQID